MKNTSADTTHSFHWDINGYRINATSTIFVFLTAGTFPIKLTDSTTGLSSERNLIVNPLPSASFTMSESSICAGSSIRFTSTSSGQASILQYYWNFEDEAVVSDDAVSDYTFNKPGTKKITLFVKDANGCYSPTSTQSTVTVNGSGTTSFTTDNGLFYSCNNTISFVNTSEQAGTSYDWDFGDGNVLDNSSSSPTHTYDKAGEYTVTLTSNDSSSNSKCISKYAQTIYVGRPQLKISAVDNICTSIAFNISATDSSGQFAFGTDDYSWQTDGGTFVSDSTALYYTSAGTYQLTVVNKKGCPSPTTKEIVVKPTPSIDFSMSPTGSICHIIPITFKAAADSDVTLKWQFGDGITKTTTNQDTVVHTYANTGTYNAVVQATNSDGCSATSPTQSITITNDCTDNGTDTLLNSVFKFTSSCEDKYLVTFEKRNTKKVLESITIDGQTYPFSSGTLTVRLPFKGKGATYSVLVKFADGTYDFAREITIMDESANFTVRNNDNASRNCAQNNYTFSTADYVNYANISKYAWTITDTRNDSLVFETAGADLESIGYIIPYASTFKISLTIWDKREQPCVSDTALLLTVYGPSGNFKSLSDSIFCTPQASIVLQNLSSIETDKYQSMTWDFGDGTVRDFSDGTIPDTIHHDYDYLGDSSVVNYNVTLKITDTDGCVASYTDSSEYKLYNPTIAVTPSMPVYCSTRTITIANESNITDLHANGFQWQVGDITQNLNLNQSFSAYMSIDTFPTYYDVKVSATYGDGITCQKDTVYPQLIKFIQPKAAFTILDSNQLSICPPYILHIENNATGYQSLQWTLSDSIYNTSLKDTILYYIERPDNYSIKLKVNGYDNCYDSTSFTFVSKGPKATLTSDTYQNCEPVTATLTLHSTDPIESYLWAFGDSSTWSSTSDYIVTHEYDKSGTYYPSVTIIGTEESGHCFNNLELATPIQVDEKINLQYQNMYSYCLGDSANGGLRLEATSDATDDFTWTTDSPTDNTIITDKSNNYIIVKPITTTSYTVVAKSNNTCPDETGTITVTTHESPIVSFPKKNITVPAGTVFNPNPEITSSFTDLKYRWTPTYGIDNPYLSNPQITADNEIVYKLNVTNTFGCTAVDSLHVSTLCASSKIFIPSAFTPNNDGKNDIFYVKGYGIKLINHFIVFNRWGNTVFERNNINGNDMAQGWNGYIGTQPAPPGTYVYLVEVTCTEGNRFNLKGTVVLIR
ncbi:MAG: PKD domain-containing protein [Chitinophagaceae bacterium]